MIVQNPWSVTKKLPAKAQACINISVLNGNMFSLCHSTFVGTYAAWLLKGGQEMVNLEHLVAGIAVFIMALLVGDRNLFKNHFIPKVVLYRSAIIIADFVPLFFGASPATVFAATGAAAVYPLMNGYIAERNNVVWGRRHDALKDRQSFNIRLHPLEMAIVALGGIVGMTLVPSVEAMVITNAAANGTSLILDIIRNRWVEDVRAETHYDNQESE